MKEHFVFYDFETTGKSTKFDQPLQFGAIVTDRKFNEVERIDIRCQLAPHILPAPFALHVTRVKPEQTINKNLPTYFEFAQKIQNFINDWSPSCWIGYNSIKFDENIMRQMFYQNLQPDIYSTQLSGNTRLDLMKMVFAVNAEVPEVLNWPTDEKGKISFKLDRLAPENGVNHEHAHDALGDVEATLFLFKKIKERAPEFFQKIFKTQDKNYIAEELKAFKPMAVTLRFGGHPPKTYQGCFCGENLTNKNQVGFLDFNLNNINDLKYADKNMVKEAVSSSPKKIRSIAVNQAETLRVLENPSIEMTRFCEVISEAHEFRNLVSTALSERFESDVIEELEIEEKIYNGFFDNSDRELLEKFQVSSWEVRLKIIDQFRDERLKQLGKRLIAFFAPHLLTEQQRSDFHNFIKMRWATTDENINWTTIQTIKEELTQMKEERLDAQYIDSLQNFYTSQFSEYGISLTI